MFFKIEKKNSQMRVFIKNLRENNNNQTGSSKNKKIKRKNQKNSQIKKLSPTCQAVLKFIRADKVCRSINKNVKPKI